MESKSQIKVLHLKKERVVNRVNYILDKCRGKSILHLGCVDSPFLEERIREGELLHQKIMRFNTDICGVDLDGDGINTMRERLNIDNLYQGDIERLTNLELDKVFDIILVPEIIEHLNNPGLFMQSIGDYLSINGQLVITVPNSLSIKVFLHGMLRREKVHPDHNYYFSPTTLRHLIESHGFKVIEMYPYWCEPRSGLAGLLDRSIRLARFVSPWVGEGVVVSAQKR